MDKIKVQQSQDICLKQIIKTIKKGNNPDQYQDYYLDQGVLLYKQTDTTQIRKWRPTLCLPQSQAVQLVHLTHVNFCNGHPTSRKLTQMIKQKYHIIGLQRLAKQEIQNCFSCSYNKLSNLGRRPIFPRRHTFFPRECFFCDICSLDEANQVKFIIFSDLATMFTFGYILPKDPENMSSEIMNYVKNFLYPTVGRTAIITDNDNNLDNFASRCFYKILGLDKSVLAARLPQANHTERIHRTLLTMLRCNFSYSKLPDAATIEDLFALMVYSFNQSADVITGLSPYQKFYSDTNSKTATNHFLNFDFVHGYFPNDARRLAKSQHLLMEFLYQKKLIQKKEYIDNFGKSKYYNEVNPYKVGDLVMLKRVLDHAKPYHKIRERYLGPYHVTALDGTSCILSAFSKDDLKSELLKPSKYRGDSIPGLRQIRVPAEYLSLDTSKNLMTQDCTHLKRFTPMFFDPTLCKKLVNLNIEGLVNKQKNDKSLHRFNQTLDVSYSENDDLILTGTEDKNTSEFLSNFPDSEDNLIVVDEEVVEHTIITDNDQRHPTSSSNLRKLKNMGKEPINTDLFVKLTCQDSMINLHEVKADEKEPYYMITLSRSQKITKPVGSCKKPTRLEKPVMSSDMTNPVKNPQNIILENYKNKLRPRKP